MIIGNPLFGIGGDLEAVLAITAPAGSTLDILQNSIVLQTYTLGASETYHEFTVDLGTYTVRGSLSGKTRNITVSAMEAAVYPITIDYVPFLYNMGDEREDLTGGWTTTNWTCPDYTKVAGAKYANNMYFAAQSHKACFLGLSNGIDLTDYETLHFAGSGNNGLLLLDTRKRWKTSAATAQVFTVNSSQAVFNISSLTGVYYIAAGAENSISYNMRLYQLWLE